MYVVCALVCRYVEMAFFHRWWNEIDVKFYLIVCCRCIDLVDDCVE